MRRLNIGAVRKLWPIAPVVLFVALFALAPAALLFASGISAVGGESGLVALLSNPLARDALTNSILQGALSAAAAMLLGYPLGVLLGRYRWRGRAVVQALLIVPFLLPSLVMVLGVGDLFGGNGIAGRWAPSLTYLGHGLPGIVTVNVLYNAPLVALLTSVGIEGAGIDLEETVATLGGGPAAAYRRVWGPPSWIGAAAGGLLTFVFSALAFAAPLLLCGGKCYTVEVWVWALDQQLLQPGMAAALAFLLVVVMLAPTVAYLFLWSRLRGGPPTPRVRHRPLPWRRWSTWPLLAASGLLLVSVLALLGGVLWTAFAPAPGYPGWGSAFSAVFAPRVSSVLGISTSGAILNSFFFGGVAAIAALVFGLFTGFVARSKPLALRVVHLVLFAPLLISPVVLAFGLAESWRPVLGGESMVWALILVSQTTLALPFALQSLNVAFSRVPPAYRETAETLGSPPYSAYLDVEVPQVRSGLITAGLFAFALGLGEFTATYFLATPRFTTLTVEIYNLDDLRLAVLGGAVAGLLVIVSLAVFAAIAVGGRRIEF
ncbi:MAG: ABC transporter permease subunit [Thermoplasmata archaeon]